MDKRQLEALLERVERAQGPSEQLDARVLCTLLAPVDSFIDQSRINGNWCIFAPKPFGDGKHRIWSTPSGFRRDDESVSRSIDVALALVGRVLPGWGYRIGVCHLSDDAFVFPDFNCPAYAEALKDTPKLAPDGAEWADFTDIDRRPAGNLPLAILESALKALIARCE